MPSSYLTLHLVVDKVDLGRHERTPQVQSIWRSPANAAMRTHQDGGEVQSFDVQDAPAWAVDISPRHGAGHFVTVLEDLGRHERTPVIDSVWFDRDKARERAAACDGEVSTLPFSD